MKLSQLIVVLILIIVHSGTGRRQCPMGKQWNRMAQKCEKYYLGSYINNYKKGGPRLLNLMATNFLANPEHKHNL
ncbi:uncharacterized protein LOC108157982 [Drosophila miranda]|uniref:uncharacterized protein LOC108157982 n=1 Tax=Drosophila miranda TaxID=7229 RepID=UPI0007E7121A|nr:uncharacterized protein LOC108157982 [Drosophila miranda]